jgi:hypothetical protein
MPDALVAKGSTPPRELDEAELRAGVEPLDHLLAVREHLVNQVAGLFALYGPGGVADSIRKNEEKRLSGMLRAMAVAQSQKITESALEEGARSHPDYLALTAAHTTGRAEYFKLNAQLEAVDMKINRGQALLRFASAEARLSQ